MTFTGYHGTDAQSANEIQADGFADTDEKGWLGAGVYFFDSSEDLAINGLSDAKWWATKVKQNTYWVIFKALLKSNKTFDMVKSKDDQDYFVNIKQRLIEQYKKYGLSLEKFCDSVVYMKIAQDKKVQLIRALVDGKAYENDFNRSYVCIYPQIQICVCRDSYKVISHFEKVDEN